MDQHAVRPGHLLVAVLGLALLGAACSSTAPSSAAQSSPTSGPGAATGSPASNGAGASADSPSGAPGASNPAPDLATEEAFLTAGVRPAAAVACAPRRTDLPPRAIAAIECVPDDGIAERVGVYRFASAADLLATYSERMAQAGVGLGSGSGCFSGPGETNYVPGPDDLTVPYREGCFVNEFGFANYRATYPDERVYVGILGSVAETAALQRWAWLGNQDQPGNPTIWRNPGP